MLLGKVLQSEPVIIVTTQLVNVRTGEIESTQRVNGAEDENVFAVVDRLTYEVKGDLALPSNALDENDPAVADVTTYSTEAYKHYLEGMEYYFDYRTEQAKEKFKEVVKHDSTFAMAWYRLASSELQDPLPYLEKAEKYMENVSHREQLYIKVSRARVSANYTECLQLLGQIISEYPDEKEALNLMGLYHSLIGQYESAERVLLNAIELDPMYLQPYNVLGYLYLWSGQFDKSEQIFDKYAELAPEEPNPIDSKGDLYSFKGEYSKAVENYKKVYEMDPDFFVDFPILAKLGDMYLLTGDYLKAENSYRKLAKASEAYSRQVGRTTLAYLSVYHGKLDEAMAILEGGLSSDHLEDVEEKLETAYKYLLAAWIHYQKGEIGLIKSKLKYAHEIMIVESSWDWLSVQVIFSQPHRMYVYLLCQTGEFEQADNYCESLKSNFDKTNSHLNTTYDLCRAIIELERGDVQKAVPGLQTGLKADFAPKYLVPFLLADAYLKNNEPGKAVPVLEESLAGYNWTRLEHVTWRVQSYYLLGQCYEATGRKDDALKSYETFLDVWKNADEGLALVEDAKARLVKLKHGS